MEITRGTTYSIPFEITNEKGETITEADAEKVEFQIGNINKTYPESLDVTFDETKKLWFVFLTQQDTLKISNTREIPYMVRVKRSETDVKASGILELKLKQTLSEVIL